MKYKLIALDLDDTLLLPDATLHPETIQTLLEAQKRGVHVVLASGRPTSGMFDIAKQLNLDQNLGYIISYNGGRITKYGSMELLYRKDITKAQLAKLLSLAEQHNVTLLTYLDDQMLSTAPSQYADLEVGFAKLPLTITTDILSKAPETLAKAMFLADPEPLAKVAEIVAPLVKDELFTTISKPFFFEFMNREVDKGASLLRLGELLNVTAEEMIAVGDSYNDLSMIKVAGMGVAMGNAVEEVKSVAQKITLPNTQNGVAAVVKELILTDN